VFIGDRLRTAEASRVKVLMRDQSVITLGPRSELVVDQMVVGDTSTSKMDAVVGSVRAVVTDRYGARGSSFEVKTPTAVAGRARHRVRLLIDSDGKAHARDRSLRHDLGAERHRHAPCARGDRRSRTDDGGRSPAASRPSHVI
jgi:hypothetical protein